MSSQSSAVRTPSQSASPEIASKSALSSSQSSVVTTPSQSISLTVSALSSSQSSAVRTLCCGTMELRMGQVFGVMAQRLLLSLTGKGRAPPKV